VRTSSTSTLSEDGVEIDGAVEVQSAIRKNIDPMAFVVSRSIEDRNL
jgi:hypothetical protein